MMKHDWNVLLKFLLMFGIMRHKFMFFHLINQLLVVSLEDGMIMNKYINHLIFNIIDQFYQDNISIPFPQGLLLIVPWRPNLIN